MNSETIKLVAGSALGAAAFAGLLWKLGSGDIATRQGPETRSVATASSAASAEIDQPALLELSGLEDGELQEIVEDMDSRWTERFEFAEATESRTFINDEGLLARQWLLRTGKPRMPWVIWEDYFTAGEGSALVPAGYAAYLGDAILVDANPATVGETRLESFMSENALHLARSSRTTNYVNLGIEEPALGRLDSLIALFQQRFPAAIAEFDVLHFVDSEPDEWRPGIMWGLDLIGATDAWSIEDGTGGSELVIAVIDTGMDLDHPDLAANLYVNPNEATPDGMDSASDSNSLIDDASGWDFFDDDATPEDIDGHGTAVAGIVGAVGNNGQGAVGASWGVKLLPIRAGDTSALTTSAINESLAYVASLKEDGVNIVATNNSYGSSMSSSTTFNEILNHRDLGILFVAAAGNDGSDIDNNANPPQFPAGHDLSNIISVASSGQDDSLSASSNYGAVSVDLSAPGNRIYTTVTGGAYGYLSGTSAASPMVAGAVALTAKANPGLGFSEIKQQVLDTGVSVPSQLGLTATGKRLDLLGAVEAQLAGHSLSVSNILDGIILLASAESKPIFELSHHPGAAIEVSIIQSTASGAITEISPSVYRYEQSGDGYAKIRFSAVLMGIERRVEKWVFLGPASDVTSGLSHLFDFSGSGTSVVDGAGDADGTLVGATRQNTEFGDGLLFEQATDAVSFPASFSGEVTITALVRSEDMAQNIHPRIVDTPVYDLYFSADTSSGSLRCRYRGCSKKLTDCPWTCRDHDVQEQLSLLLRKQVW